MTARRVGELALEYAHHRVLVLEHPSHGDVPPCDAKQALADLRALMAEHDKHAFALSAARDTQASLADMVDRQAESLRAAQAECARLRAALVRVEAWSRSFADARQPLPRDIADDMYAALAHEERSGAAASTAGVKP